MLTIRSEQMTTLGALPVQRFVDQLIRRLRSKNYRAVAAMDDSGLRACVLAAIDRAGAHGIDTASAQAAFATLMFGIGPQFDRQPLIARIVGNRGIPADERIALLADVVPLAVWQAARPADPMAAWADALSCHGAAPPGQEFA